VVNGSSGYRRRTHLNPEDHMTTAAPAVTITDLMNAFAHLRMQNARAVGAFATEHGIGATDLRALTFLNSNPSATPKQVAEHLGLTTGAMTTLIDRIEKVGLVKRSPNPDDRRSLVLDLTPAGDKVIEDTLGVYLTAFTQALDGLDYEQVHRAFTAVAEGLARIAEERDPSVGAAAE
jgi:DNA-binding MarR family transcriptional regulator